MKKIGIIGFGGRVGGLAISYFTKFFPELVVTAIADIDLEKVKNAENRLDESDI